MTIASGRMMIDRKIKDSSKTYIPPFTSPVGLFPIGADSRNIAFDKNAKYSVRDWGATRHVRTIQ
jgi:hypothetical protein